MLTIKKVIDTLKKHKIRYSWDAEKHLPLEQLGMGCYREVYAVEGLNVAVKFPLKGKGNLSHARHEMKALDRLAHSAPPELRKHLPKVYWSDWKTGIIVMKKYRDSWAAGKKLSRMLADFFNTCPDYNDFRAGNFGRDSNNRLIILDLGLT